jgi:protein gp37
MSETTGIGWTDATWNPWYGCTKVSPGCAHCYMFRDMVRYGRDPEVVTRSKTKFTEPLKWKEPRRVFTCSWSDWFHEGADAWRDDAWAVIRETPHLTYQILTKRPDRIAAHLPLDWGEGWSNVWLGVSVENQRFAERAALLAKLPARVRFISAEPLLGPVVFGSALDGIHWIIAGGESGPDSERRPMDLDWARGVRDQAVGRGIAFHLKQLGGPPGRARSHADALLDGRTWTEFPR